MLSHPKDGVSLESQPQPLVYKFSQQLCIKASSSSSLFLGQDGLGIREQCGTVNWEF